MSLLRPIFHHAKIQPDAPALMAGTRTIAYGDLALTIGRTAAHLAKQDLRAGDRIGVALKDNPDHLIALLAIASLGGTAVPLDWRARAVENERIAKALDLRCVLAEPDAPALEDCRAIICDESWQAAIAATLPNRATACDWNTPFVISASSGSTGAPKFTFMTHLQYHFAIAGLLELTPLLGRHRFLCTLPLFYAGGRANCLAHLVRGDCVVLYPSLFGPDEYIAVATRTAATVSMIVPSVVRQLLTSRGPDLALPNMAALVNGGAPLHAEEKRQALRRLSPNFFDRYGTAETLTIASLHPADVAAKAESVGRTHSLAEIEIVDEDDRPLPDGEAGRLRYRSPGMASPLAGAAANFRNGWFYPGEIARLDRLGYLFLQGRSSEVIIRGGAKIYPVEVETVLSEHPAILEAAVIGRSSANNDEDVLAFVVTRQTLSAGELIAHCRARLTPHKVPRQIVFLERLPKNAAGKIDKQVLAAALEGSR